MALHRMNSVTIGVPNVAETAEFYRDFNLTETAPGVFATRRRRRSAPARPRTDPPRRRDQRRRRRP